MRPTSACALALLLIFAALPSHANPDPAYDQTRDWVVTTITESAGYTSDSTVLAYKDVSMDACQLRFSTVTTTSAGYTETATFPVSLDSLNNVLWGSAPDPLRGYVVFTTATPITLSRQTSRASGLRPSPALSTTVAALEFGKSASDAAETAKLMRAALLRASSLCRVQIASE